MLKTESEHNDKGVAPILVLPNSVSSAMSI
jgi:hypothetical protein